MLVQALRAGVGDGFIFERACTTFAGRGDVWFGGHGRFFAPPSTPLLGVRTHAGFQRGRKSLQAAEEHELILHSAVGAGACDCVAEAPRPVGVPCAGGRRCVLILYHS